jgi:hypothetical protein
MALDQRHRAKTNEKAKFKVQGKARPKKAHAKTVKISELDTGKCKGNL